MIKVNTGDVFMSYVQQYQELDIPFVIEGSHYKSQPRFSFGDEQTRDCFCYVLCSQSETVILQSTDDYHNHEDIVKKLSDYTVIMHNKIVVDGEVITVE